MTTADRVLAAILAMIVAAVALNAVSTPSAGDVEVPAVIVREVTDPDGVQHMCAITEQGGISCDWTAYTTGSAP